jgi:outer membrane protein OmpA-like peptidoglycan-associated protein
MQPSPRHWIPDVIGALGWLPRSCRSGLLCALVVGAVTLCPTAPSIAAGQPTEDEILKALQQKRFTRCPQISAGCGADQEAFAKRGILVEVTFDYGSAVLRPQARAVLTALRDRLFHRRADEGVLFVAGHADAKGSDDYNQALSERRATAVKRFLMRHFNVRSRMLKAVGFGDTQPKNPGDPFAAENRRVQIVEAQQ